MSIGTRIKDLRKEKELTQDNLETVAEAVKEQVK